MDSAALSTRVLEEKISEYKWTGNSFSYKTLMSVHTNNTASVAGSRLAILSEYFVHTDSYSIFVVVGTTSHIAQNA
jgi:hypothetical protein